MANTNGKITAPVEIADVTNVLGASSSDLGTLCTHDNINVWSLKKPVRHPKLFASLTEQDWWQGKNNTEGFLDDTTCGLLVGEAFDQLVKKANIINTENGFTKANLSGDTECFLHKLAKGTTGHWEYLRPQGLEAGSPYRLDDFRDYNHRAKNPMPAPSTSQLTDGIFYFGNNTIDLNLDVPEITLADSLTNVTLNALALPATMDAMTLNQMYWGILIYSEDLRDCMWATAKTAGQKVVTFEQNANCTIAGRKGKYKARAFFSSKPIDTNAVTMPASDKRLWLLSAKSDVIDLVLMPYGTPPVELSLSIKTDPRGAQCVITNNEPQSVLLSSCAFDIDNLGFYLEGLDKATTIAPFNSYSVLVESAMVRTFKVKAIVDGVEYTATY